MKNHAYTYCTSKGKHKGHVHRRKNRGWDSNYARMRDGMNWPESEPNYRIFNKLLRSWIGKPWNEFYSELCRTVDKRSKRGWAFHDMLNRWVTLSNEIEKEDGEYYFKNWRKGIPAFGFFVDPETGLLCEAQDKKWKTNKDKELQRRNKELARQMGLYVSDDEDIIRIPDHKDYWKKCDGIWYMFRYDGMKIINKGTKYEDVQYKWTKLQLSSRELKQSGLKNDNSS